jgi:hypothetical protein
MKCLLHIEILYQLQSHCLLQDIFLYENSIMGLLVIKLSTAVKSIASGRNYL